MVGGLELSLLHHHLLREHRLVHPSAALFAFLCFSSSSALPTSTLFYLSDPGRRLLFEADAVEVVGRQRLLPSTRPAIVVVSSFAWTSAREPVEADEVASEVGGIVDALGMAATLRRRSPVWKQARRGALVVALGALRRTAGFMKDGLLPVLPT